MQFDPNRGFVPARLIRVAADGTQVNENVALGDMLALGGDRYVVVTGADAGATDWYITAYAWTGGQLWQRTFPKTFWPSALAIGPDGAFVLAGWFEQGTSFGDGELEIYNTPDGAMNTFVAVFDTDGGTRFSRRITASTVNGLSSSGERIAVSVDHWTQFPYPEIHVFDSAGTLVGGAGNVGFDEHGFTGSVAIGASGRLWANLGATPYFPPWTRFPVLVSLDP